MRWSTGFTLTGLGWDSMRMMVKVQPRKRPKTYPVKDLSYIVGQGGRIRRNKYAREVMALLWPVIFAILLQSSAYILVTIRPGRSDWPMIFLAAIVLAFVPLSTGLILAGLRRHGSAIITATITTTGLFSVAVSVLSALRVPVSYQGLAASFPFAVLTMAYANVRFQRSFAAKVALASFSQAKELASKIGGARILNMPLEDISDIEILLIDPREHHSEEWSALMAKCYLGGIEIMPWTRYIEIRRGRLDVSSFDVSHLAYSPTQLLYARLKRPLDLLLLLLTLPVTIPVALMVALYIALRDGGPVLFVQLRRGYGGKTFRMYKFRTMYKGTGGGATMVSDSRIIPGCGILRKLRLDELPQLYNILLGDMSLIGPRPEAIDLAKIYEREIPQYPMRLLVLPGITGWAQVNNGYTSTSDEALVKLSHDLYYIKHLSLDLDLLIVFRTVRTLLIWVGAR